MKRTIALFLLFSLVSCGGSSGGTNGQDDGSNNVSSNGPVFNGCPVFPADHPLNTAIDALPLNPRSDQIIQRLDITVPWKLSLAPVKPYNVVQNGTHVPINYVQPGYSNSSSPTSMPIPDNPVFMIKTPGNNALGQPKVLYDVHAMFVDTAECKSYEVWNFDGIQNPDESYNVGTGYVYDLNSSTLPPDHSITPTASGLSVFATLARSEEILAGEIKHAIGMVTMYTSDGFIHPAISFQSKFGSGPDWDNTDNPVMGMRLRLKADYDISSFPPQSRVVLTALKKYGAIIADGSPGAGMMANDDQQQVLLDYNDLNDLWQVPHTAFEVVDSGPVLQ